MLIEILSLIGIFEMIYLFFKVKKEDKRSEEFQKDLLMVYNIDNFQKNKKIEIAN